MILFIRDGVLYFSCDTLFCNAVMLSSWNELVSVPFSIFWKSLRTVVNSLNVW